MKINWRVRLQNKAFWSGIVGLSLLVVQVLAKRYGWTINIGSLSSLLNNLLTVIFSAMTMVGVVVDPTTSRIRDSNQALSYKTPNKH